MALLDQNGDYTETIALTRASENNTALARLKRYNLHFSLAMQDDLSQEHSKLREELERLELSNDERVNKYLLQMLIVFYEDGSLEENRVLLLDHAFIKSLISLMWDDIQIRLIPVMLNKKYNTDLMQSILAKGAYYRSYSTLIQLGLTEDIPSYFAKPEKLAQLNYIDSLTDKHKRELCLIFWSKGNLSIDELKDLVSATEKYPMLAATLVALDQNKTFIYVNKLRKIALDPCLHQRYSILHHFVKEFDKYALNKSSLAQLNVEELAELSCSLIILKQAEITSPKAYRMLLNKDNNAQLLRLFIPGLAEIDTIKHRNALINLLYLSIQNGVISTGKTLLRITDEPLAKAAEHLFTRFICVKQLQDLRCKDEHEIKGMLALAAQDGNENAARFRKIIMNVEAECKNVHERLRRSAHERDKVGQWQLADEEYRRTLYCLAYDGITKSGSNVDLRVKLQQAEKKILSIVDPEIRGLLHRSLVIIANLLITVLTLGLANEIKEKKTGNFWFFNQTTSGEKLRALDKDVIELIESPMRGI